MKKVEKCLKEKQEWFEKQSNAQSKLPLTQNPVVLTTQIKQTTQVRKTLMQCLALCQTFTNGIYIPD